MFQLPYDDGIDIAFDAAARDSRLSGRQTRFAASTTAGIRTGAGGFVAAFRTALTSATSAAVTATTAAVSVVVLMQTS